MQAHPALVLNADFRPRASELLAAKRAFPPNYLHETWLDFLYWDTEIESEMERAEGPPGPSHKAATNLSSRSSEEELRASNAGNAQVRLLSGGPALDGSAEWSASGPENRGDLTVRGSIPQPSAKFT